MSFLIPWHVRILDLNSIRWILIGRYNLWHHIHATLSIVITPRTKYVFTFGSAVSLVALSHLRAVTVFVKAAVKFILGARVIFETWTTLSLRKFIIALGHAHHSCNIIFIWKKSKSSSWTSWSTFAGIIQRRSLIHSLDLMWFQIPFSTSRYLWASFIYNIFFFDLCHIALKVLVWRKVFLISKISIDGNVSHVSSWHESSVGHLRFTTPGWLFVFSTYDIGWKTFPVYIFSFSHSFLMTFVKTLVKNYVELFFSGFLIKIELQIHAFTIKIESWLVLV